MRRRTGGSNWRGGSLHMVRPGKTSGMAGEAPACTFGRTGRSVGTAQDWFYCYDCGLVGDNGCCASCAATCHALHRVELHRVSADFFCDCGADGLCEVAREEQRRALTERMAAAKCSFGLTGRKYAVQPLYECLTCGLGSGEGVCEACKTSCHSGHLVVKVSDASAHFCDCGAKGLCMRFRADKVKEHMDGDQCSFNLTGRAFARQDWYQCRSCHDMSGRNGCCEACARTCHQGHDVFLKEVGASFFCDCGAKGKCRTLREQGVLEDHMASGGCSFELTGRRFVNQAWYTCKTCKLTDDEGCCAACAVRCHRGHDVVFGKATAAFFCDCGAKGMCDHLRRQNDDLGPEELGGGGDGFSSADDDAADDMHGSVRGSRRGSASSVGLRRGSLRNGGRTDAGAAMPSPSGAATGAAMGMGMGVVIGTGTPPEAGLGMMESVPDSKVEEGDDDAEDADDGQCCVCMEAPREAVLVHTVAGTGHQCVCMDCANMLKDRGESCPICRSTIDYVIKNFGAPE